MGIQGLLPLLKDIQRNVSLQAFKGQTVGIDAYCWLHKGAYGCAFDLAEGKDSSVYLNYILRRITMLQNYGITPILVFDGGYLPAKASKEAERRRTREEYLRKGKALLRSGDKSQAVDCFQKCVNITPAMATKVIKACRSRNVFCIVAPYEADAQLAYLQKEGITSLTITEDSDLLIYGCSKVLFKMTADGDGILIDLADLNKVRSRSFSSFTFEKFRHMCMLSGCDYLPSIKGMGLIKSYKIIVRSSDVYRAIKSLRLENGLKVPKDYENNFRKADAVFKFQSVFDHRKRKIVPLNEVTKMDDVTQEDLNYAGPPLTEEKAVAIALGNLDPISGDVLADFEDFHDALRNTNTQQESVTKSEKSSFVFQSPKKSTKHHVTKCKEQCGIQIYEDPEPSIANLYRDTKPPVSPTKLKTDLSSSLADHTTSPRKRSVLNPFKRNNRKEQTDSQGPETSKYFSFGIRSEQKEISNENKNNSALELLLPKPLENEDSSQESSQKQSKPLLTLDLNSPDSPISPSSSQRSNNSDDKNQYSSDVSCYIESSPSKENMNFPTVRKESSLDERKHASDGSTNISSSSITTERTCSSARRIGLFNQNSSTKGKNYITSLLQRFSHTTAKHCNNIGTGVSGMRKSASSSNLSSTGPLPPENRCLTQDQETGQKINDISVGSASCEAEDKGLSEVRHVVDLTDSPVFNNRTPGRCKSVGLSKKRKSAEPICSSNKKLNQTKLTLEKYAFQRKSISW